MESAQNILLIDAADDSQQNLDLLRNRALCRFLRLFGIIYPHFRVVIGNQSGVNWRIMAFMAEKDRECFCSHLIISEHRRCGTQPSGAQLMPAESPGRIKAQDNSR